MEDPQNECDSAHPESRITQGDSVVSCAKNIREHLREYEGRILSLENLLPGKNRESDGSVKDIGESFANIKLAYRHLEDCIMRLRKVCEAVQGRKVLVNGEWVDPKSKNSDEPKNEHGEVVEPDEE